MNNTLLSKIAQDLNVVQFINEPQNLYIARVVYSALAAWMKIIPLDGYNEKDVASTSVTKKYHTQRAKEILDEILCFFPEIRYWFYDVESLQDNSFPLHSIQELLVANDELFIDDTSNRIYAVASTTKKISESLAGDKVVPDNLIMRYNGVHCFSKIEDGIVYKSEPINGAEFFDNLIKSLPFSVDNWNVEKEYFDPTIETMTFYKSWLEKAPVQKYYVSRIGTGIKQYRYFIETLKNGKRFSCKLNEFFLESGNLKRILLTLRSKANNPLRIKAIRYKDHVEINKNITALPYPEEYMIRALGWPIQSISDEFHYVYNNEVWPQIHRIMENLTIDMDEVNYEGSV